MKKLVLIIFAISLTNWAYSQKRILTGQIVDENLKPLLNAIVIDCDQRQSTRTNENGYFQLEIDSKMTKIQIQFVGLHTEDVIIKNKCHINVIMFEDVLVEWNSIKKENQYFQMKRRKINGKYKKAIRNGFLQKEKDCK